MARQPYALRKLEIPSLARWEHQGRLAIAMLSIHSMSFILISIYGFPPSHDLRESNEEMFKHVLTWMSSLKVPTLCAGDWNASREVSECLTLVNMHDLWILNDAMQPTTTGKTRISGGQAIDHAVVNSQFLDYAIHMQVDYDRPVSDHYPLCGAWTIHHEPRYIWRWPRPMKVEAEKKGQCERKNIPWSCVCTSFESWSSYSSRWISEVTGVQHISKSACVTQPWQPKAPVADSIYCALLAIIRAATTIQKTRNPSTRQWTSLQRKLRAINMDESLATYQNLENLRDVAEARLKDAMQHAQDSALKQWNARVRSWNGQSKHIYKYLRNLAPDKAVIMQDDDDTCTSSPQRIHTLLSAYWSSIENWQQPTHEQEAWEILDDHYSIYLPQVHACVVVEPKMLQRQAKRMKVTAPGLDAWSVEEARLLPTVAWAALLHLLNRNQWALPPTNISLYKRVPL